MKVGLISDTHVPTSLPSLPDGVFRVLRGVDAILHAGDIVSQPVLDALRRIAPVTAVAGNMDPPELSAVLPDRALVELGGRTIGLKHGHQPHGLQAHYIGSGYDSPAMTVFYQLMAAQLPGAEIIVFGHFHRPVVRTWNGTLFVNPGAVAGPPAAATLAILDLDRRSPTATIVPLSP